MFKKWLKDLHWPLIIAMLALSALGILFIYSSSYREFGGFQMKQLFWASIGFAVFFMMPLLGYRTFLSSSYLLYAISLVLLVWVDVAGHTRLGAQRWIGIGPLVIQPSEFAKLSTVLALANFLGSHHSWEKENRIILGAIAMTLVPMFLIMKQPDLGTSLMFVPILVVLLLLWGIRYRYLISAAVMGAVAAPFLWVFLKEYQKKRILVFLNPQMDPLGSGYTAIQSKIAVGSGGFWGKGFMQGTQSQLNFVPEHHTDFIFCVLGEEWGFLGSVLLLFLYGYLFHALFQIMTHTTDFKAKLLTAGVLSVIFAQVFINIGMTMGMMPIAGLPLPFVSYGGSSFVSISIALGLALSVHKERSIF